MAHPVEESHDEYGVTLPKKRSSFKYCEETQQKKQLHAMKLKKRKKKTKYMYMSYSCTHF